MYAEKPAPSTEQTLEDGVLESDPLGIQLTEYRYVAATSVALQGKADASFALIVAGTLQSAPGEAYLTEGDVLSDVAYTAASPVQLWQLSGSRTAVAQLHHFTNQLIQKDRLTAAHAARVGQLARQMGLALHFDPERLGALSLAAYLHDIGKLKLPKTLLASRERLTLAQWQLMAQHPRAGRRLLAQSYFAPLGPILEQHHERLDGSGYPEGLAGDAVSLEAYIVAVADTFDAITHNRPYQTARNSQQALSEINRYSRVLYPSHVVSALNQVLRAPTD